MKFAFYPGCVSRGGCPELYAATVEVCDKLGIELDAKVLELNMGPQHPSTHGVLRVKLKLDGERVLDDDGGLPADLQCERGGRNVLSAAGGVGPDGYTGPDGPCRTECRLYWSLWRRTVRSPCTSLKRSNTYSRSARK